MYPLTQLSYFQSANWFEVDHLNVGVGKDSGAGVTEGVRSETLQEHRVGITQKTIPEFWDAAICIDAENLSLFLGPEILVTKKLLIVSKVSWQLMIISKEGCTESRWDVVGESSNSCFCLPFIDHLDGILFCVENYI